MSVTAAANVLSQAATIAATMDSVTVISVQTIAGEIFRKIPTTTVAVTAKKKEFTFWLDETEGNGDIIGLSLYGNGATATLGTGAELAKQVVAITKTNTESLTVAWTVEVAQ